MDGHRSYPDDNPPRWYAGEPGYPDAEWDRPRGVDPRLPDEGPRVPEPRSGAGPDPRYDGLTDTQERRYGAPGPFGERDPIDGAGARRSDGGLGSAPGGAPLDPLPGGYGAGHRVDSTRSSLDPATQGFEQTRSYGDPTVPVERTGSFHSPGSSPPTVGPRSSEALPAPLAPPIPQPLGPPLGQHPGTPLGPQPVPPPLAEPPRQHSEPFDRAALRRGPAAPVGEGVYRTRRPLLVILFAVAVGIFEIPALRLLISGAFGDRVSTTAVVAGTFLTIGLPAFGMGLYGLLAGAARVPGQATGPGWLRPPVIYLAVGLTLFVAAGLAAT